MADATTISSPAVEPVPGKTSLPARLTDFFVRLARQKPMGFVSLLFIVFLLVVAAVPSIFATYAPADNRAGERYQSYCFGPKDSFLCPTFVQSSGLRGDIRIEGSTSNVLGTDAQARDNYSRIIYGTRVAVFIGFGAVIVSSIIAMAIGIPAGYFGGKIDSVLQRFVDAVMALPVLPLLIALPLMIGGPTYTKLIFIFGILGGSSGSRVIRAAVLGVRNMQYMEAARALGATDGRIMLRHIIPNIFGPLMVQATIGLGSIILAEAAISFLGFGVTDVDQPSWGAMLREASAIASVHPWQAVWSGLAITLAVFAFNMFGDAVRDLLDPRLRGGGGRFS